MAMRTFLWRAVSSQCKGKRPTFLAKGIIEISCLCEPWNHGTKTASPSMFMMMTVIILLTLLSPLESEAKILVLNTNSSSQASEERQVTQEQNYIHMFRSV